MSGVREVIGGGGEVIAREIGVRDPLREPTFGAEAVAGFDRRTQLFEIAALVRLERRRIENGRLAPRLPALRGVDRALGQQFVPAFAELLADVMRRERGDQRMLRVL